MPPKKKEASDEDDAVGPPKRRSSAEVELSPSVMALTTWTVEDDPERPLSIVLPGPSHFNRQEVLKQYRDGTWRRFHSGIVIDAMPPKSVEWLEGDIATNFLTRIRQLQMPPVSKEIMASWYPRATGIWELLWNLIAVEEFVVEEPLRQLIDKPFYLVHDVHRAIWEARFLAREHATLDATEGLMVIIDRWLMGEPLGDDGRRVLSTLGIKRLITKDAERLDVACFLLSLACQNGLLERSIFLFDDLEHALQPNRRSMLRQLRDLLDTGRRWARLGSNPLGVVLGFTGTQTDLQLLTKFNPTLGAEVREGLVRARKTLSS